MEFLAYDFDTDKKNQAFIQATRTSEKNVNIYSLNRENWRSALESGDVEDFDDGYDAINRNGRKMVAAEADVEHLKQQAANFAKRHASELFTNALTLARLDGVAITLSPESQPNDQEGEK